MTLSEYLLARLGKLNDVLGYESSDLEIVITDALTDYGVETESDATNLNKIRKLALVHLYQKILVELSQNFDFSADGSSYKYSQFYEQVKQLYFDAVTDAMIFSPNYKISVTRMGSQRDEYYANYHDLHLY